MMKTYINFGGDYIQIQAETKSGLIELCYWDKQEWIDDPELVFSITNAVKIAKEHPDRLFEAVLSKPSRSQYESRKVG